MDQDPTVLLIDQDPDALDSIRRVLGDQASRFKLRRIADVPTALARIWGGGIDLVLLNLPASANPAGSTGRKVDAPKTLWLRSANCGRKRLACRW